MMSIFQNKPYPTKIPRKLRNPEIYPRNISKNKDYKVEELFSEPKKDVIYGKVNLLDAHRSQCKWLYDMTMVCGEPVVKESSWCKEHYCRVFRPVSVAKAHAAEMRKRREIEKWPDRKKF